MKKRFWTLLLALLLLTSCTGPEQEGDWKLYFPTVSYTNGPALVSQSLDLEQTPGPEELIRLLLTGPEGDELYSPFPRGVSLRSWYLEEGVLHINLSEQYGGLSGMALTLADYSIALTLCQLPGVEGVSITVENDPMPFRYRQTLSPEDILLSDLPSGDAMTEENH